MRISRVWTIGIGFAAMTSPAVGAVMVPAYNSYPSAFAQLYLDFDGDNTSDFGPYHPGVTPAYSIDADTNDFIAQELDNIHTIWAEVAEKYSPFKLNVTTVDPGNANDLQTSRVVIGGDGSWAPKGSGGIAAIYSFVDPTYPNVGFVFPGHLDNGNPRYVGEASAHEAGHSFGLHHQSLYSDGGDLLAEYNPGDANKAPIMGVSYYSTRGKWWSGLTETGNQQDDLFILSRTGSSTNNFGYRPDDHGSTIATADPLSVAPDFSITGYGIIEKTTDVDYFSFATPGGVAHLAADVSPYAPMLDLSLKLYDANGVLLSTAATSSLGEAIDYPLSAGTYELAVLSARQYGDIGQYFLSGSVIPEPACLAGTILLLLAPLGRRRRLR